MTEEAQQLEKNQDNSNVNTVISDNQSSMDSIKIKVECKKEKCRPMTKVVIRRLPPTMTENQFIEQVSPIPDHDYLYFVKADISLGQNAFSRAYINFLEQQDIFMFREKFDNYIFLDSKGTEYPAVVEFAPFQRLPKKRPTKKKDPKCGTIETDPYYMTFLESLKNQDADNGTAQPKTEYSYQPFDNTQKKVTTTPLLEYLKLRKAEKQRIRDEKREERRRRDIERRRIKDELTISKVLKNPDIETSSSSRENKENKDALPPIKEIRNRKRDDTKVRDKVLITRDREPGKSTGNKSYRDKEDRKQERESKQYSKKHEEKKSHNRREEREEKKSETKNKEDRRENKGDGSQQKEKVVLEEKKGKSYEKMRQEKRLRVSESKKQGSWEENPLTQLKQGEDFDINTKEYCKTNVDIQSKFVLRTSDSQIDISRSSDNVIMITKDSEDEDTFKLTKMVKTIKRRSSLESGGEGGGGDCARLRRHKSLDGGNENNLQKNKSDNKNKDKKDPRLERRIRNKDRPAMEIYRPGMGKFSKQRLERGKPTHDDRASLSQSPTPGGNKSTGKTNDACQTTESRSMIFKRSISRDAT